MTGLRQPAAVLQTVRCHKTAAEFQDFQETKIQVDFQDIQDIQECPCEKSTTCNAAFHQNSLTIVNCYYMSDGNVVPSCIDLNPQSYSVLILVVIENCRPSVFLHFNVNCLLYYTLPVIL